MDFQQKDQIKYQLAQLRNQLFKSHLYISIPLTIIILIGFIIFNLTIIVQHQATSPQFILPQLIQKQYTNLIQYFDYFHDMVNQLLALNATNPNYRTLSDTVQQNMGNKMGMICIIGSQTTCNAKFIGIATISWQFNKLQTIKQLIQTIIVCVNENQLTCASTVPKQSTYSQQQLKYIRSQAEPAIINSIEKNVYNTKLQRAYIIGKQSNNITTIIKLTQFSQALKGIAEMEQESTIQVYQIQLLYPYKQLIKNSGIISDQQQHIQDSRSIYLKQSKHTSQKNNKIIQFVIKYQRYDQYRTYSTKLSALVPLLLILYIIRVQRFNVTKWVEKNFARKKLINQLYKFTIRDIFKGTKLNLSNVLQKGPASQMFRQLSGLVDKTIVPITRQPQQIQHKQAFKFNRKINQIVQKYKQNIKSIMYSKNKYILSNRFNIQTYINDLCEVENKLMKEYFVRAQQLNITESFFMFAYNAILRSPSKFIAFVQEDQTPLPKKLVDYFIKTNQHIHQVCQIREKIENLSNNPIVPADCTSSQLISQQDNHNQQNKEQLEIRIRVHIIPKYLAMLKDLDIQNHYAQKLKLERELWSLGQIIQNTRYLLTKHNKSIRSFNK